jgi:hypothetical protein
VGHTFQTLDLKMVAYFMSYYHILFHDRDVTLVSVLAYKKIQKFVVVYTSMSLCSYQISWKSAILKFKETCVYMSMLTHVYVCACMRARAHTHTHTHTHTH